MQLHAGTRPEANCVLAAANLCRTLHHRTLPCAVKPLCLILPLIFSYHA